MSMFRTLLMQKKGGLPPGVVLYDYLVGDGTAYIDTGIKPSAIATSINPILMELMYGRTWDIAPNDAI